MTTKPKTFDAVAEWVAIFKFAEENGIEESKVQQLYKQTNLNGGTPSMKEEELMLLRGYVKNEIEVRQAKEALKNGTNADLGIESVELQRVGLTEADVEEDPKPATAQSPTGVAVAPVQTSVDAQEESPSDPKLENTAKSLAEPAAEQQSISTTVDATTEEAPQEQPPKSISVGGEANAAVDSQTQKLTEVDGYYLNEDGEVVGMTPEAEERLIGKPPEELGFAPEERFEIRDEASANWVLEKITGLQMHIEKIKNQTKVIEGRDNTRINGLLWRFGSELHNYGLSQLPIAKTGKKAGQYSKKSLVLTEGTIAFEATGGPKCVDKFSFLDHVESIPEEELPFHPAIAVVTKRVPDTKAYEAMVANGEEIPGWVFTDINPVGQMKVKVSKLCGKNTQQSEVEE